MKKSIWNTLNPVLIFGSVILLILADGLCPSNLRAAQPGQAGAPANDSITTSTVIKITPDTPPAALVGRSDNEMLELPSGRKLRLGDLRRFSGKASALKSAAAGSKPMPQVFRIQPAAKGIALKSGSDLSAALKRPDSETVELPSGRRVTVGQIRFLQPYLEKRLGQKLSRTKSQDKPGEVLKVQTSTDKAYWKMILQKSDNTILESPDGTRITVGELKQTLAAHKSARSASIPISR